MRIILLAALVMLATAAPLGAAEMSLFVADSADNLLEVNVETGVTTLAADLDVQYVDIAFAPSGRLYGITREHLYAIDPDTGWGTLIGAHGFGDAATGAGLDSLAATPDGSLLSAGNDLLIAIDPETGVGSKVGGLSGYRSAGDLDFDAAGRLLLTTDTGMLVRVMTDGSGAIPIGSLPYNDVYALAAAPDGRLFGVRGTNDLLAIDPLTGAASTVGRIRIDSLIGRAFGASFPYASVPEPAAAILIFLVAPWFVRGARTATVRRAARRMARSGRE